MRLRVDYQTECLRHYLKAYGLIVKNYKSCHLAADDFILVKMIERLPHLMSRLSMPRERVDKVLEDLLVCGYWIYICVVLIFQISFFNLFVLNMFAL